VDREAVSKAVGAWAFSAQARDEIMVTSTGDEMVVTRRWPENLTSPLIVTINRHP
jgi:hypothetical protein